MKNIVLIVLIVLFFLGGGTAMRQSLELQV